MWTKRTADKFGFYDQLVALSEMAYLETVPDWVYEVLSPSTASKDREVKMPIHGRYGVSYAWLVVLARTPAATLNATVRIVRSVRPGFMKRTRSGLKKFRERP